jgi:phage recombination protein Bet
MTTDMIVRENESTLTTTWTEDDLKALKQTVAKDCSPEQFKVFMVACARLGLDPFARQITPIVMSGRMTPQVTIDGFRLIAERTQKYRGQLGPYWCGKDGVWVDVWLSDEPPAAAKVGILRSDFTEPLWGVARYKSYAKGGMWTSMPDVMVAKVAESIGLRKAFPNQLSGAYTREEMEQAQAEQHEDARVIEATTATVTPATPTDEPRGRTTVDGGPVIANANTQRQNNEVRQQQPVGGIITQPVVDLGPDVPVSERETVTLLTPNWATLEGLATTAHLIRNHDDWGRLLVEITGKQDPKKYTPQDRTKVHQHILAKHGSRNDTEVRHA